MPIRTSSVCLANLLALTALLLPSGARAQSPSTFKVAFYNIQSGKGEPALPGHEVRFVDTANCTDFSQPVNAWAIGLPQAHLVASIANDPNVVALGLIEAWVCGNPENVRRALGWPAATGERNGVAMVARYGFAGPAEWLQLDTSLNPNPADTMWVLRVPVCLDASCSRSMQMFTTHWYATGTYKEYMFDRQGAQTMAFVTARAGTEPHVLGGDFNVWEGVATCSQTPTSAGLSHLRSAGYIDAWPAIHGSAEGFTGMTNRPGCGSPEGYTWKRIDYSWTPPGMQPYSIERFGMEPPGEGQPSDHYGIIAEYAMPGSTVPPPPPPQDPPPPPPPPPPPADPGDEVVLYASDVTATSGAWQAASDVSAAGGVRLWHPDAGLPKINVALASPAHYFEMTFNAVAGKPYRLWLRLLAQNNYWANDSVHVQFSGAVNANGSPVYRIGTTDAAWVNLEDGANLGVSGWGWQDNGYGAGVLGSLIYFSATGTQTIRVQTREDGVSIDQIVLSAARYLTAAPGALKQDATIVAKPEPEPEPEPDPPPTMNRAEIVLLGAEATAYGAWRRVADATAAGGAAMTHPDAGAAKLTTALATPSNYIELTFDAEAGRPYRLWIRGRADADYWGNDSVFVQFSDAVDTSGNPALRIGTTSAGWVNLEDGANVGISGWGWQDNGYGPGVLGPLVTFGKTGLQTIRIQTREDGFRIDQVVLSSATYLTTSPGLLKNDNTKLR